MDPTDEIVKQVFPTLEVIGWYTIGSEPTADDLLLQQQVRLADIPRVLN